MKWFGLALLGTSAWLLLRSRPARTALPTPGAPGAPGTPGTPRVVRGEVIAEGTASFYGPGFHGRQTANGEVFNQEALTAAHRTLPFGTRVLVTDLETGRSVTVRINDRGPFTKRDGAFSREIDLSVGAARTLDMLQRGLAHVRLERVL